MGIRKTGGMWTLAKKKQAITAASTRFVNRDLREMEN